MASTKTLLRECYSELTQEQDPDQEEDVLTLFCIYLKTDEPTALHLYKLEPKDRIELDREVSSLLKANTTEAFQSSCVCMVNLGNQIEVQCQNIQVHIKYSIFCSYTHNFSLKLILFLRAVHSIKFKAFLNLTRAWNKIIGIRKVRNYFIIS